MTSYEAADASSGGGMAYAATVPYVYQQAQYVTTSPPPMNTHYATDSAGNIYAMYAQPPQMYDYSQQHQQTVAPTATHQAKPGTLPPGTAIGIGDYTVIVEQYLSEGGFAHVYLVRTSEPLNLLGEMTDQLVLKRVAVPDKETLREVRWEVDVMKLVRGHRHIVNLIEATAAPMQSGTGYEVFILMEYCAGGGIIDMMNTRLQNRLTEAEILKIFSDVVEGVCWMHTRDPPLIHRDLKVENILLAGYQQYKVCDFGSTAKVSDKIPTTMDEIKALEVELNKHTTMQYRAPEMCDVWSRKGVGLPADVWALGVLLYKLCFYTTPFEDQGPLAILNAQYTMPQHPPYSSRIRSLVASMLVEKAAQRPTAYEVHVEVCKQRNVPFNKDYQPRAAQAPAQNTPSPAFSSRIATPNLPSRIEVASATITTSSAQTSGGVAPFTANAIQPMRRGRPNKSLSVSSHAVESMTDRPSLSRAPSNASTSAIAPPVVAGQPAPMGFEDSFEPEATVTEGTSNPSVLVEQAQSSTETSSRKTKTALATAALFEELTNPGSANKGPQTLAAMQAQLERDNSRAVAPSNFTWSSQRRVTPSSKPAGPRTQIGNYGSSSVPTITAILAPPYSPQTGRSAYQDSSPVAAMPGPGSAPSTAVLTASQTASMQRYPTIDDWDAGFPGQVDVDNAPISHKTIDLLGDIASDNSLIAPDRNTADVPPDLEQTMSASPFASPDLMDENNAQTSISRESLRPIKGDSSMGETVSQCPKNNAEMSPTRQNSAISNRSVRSIASVFSGSSATSTDTANGVNASQKIVVSNTFSPSGDSTSDGQATAEQEAAFTPASDTVRSPLLNNTVPLGVTKKLPLVTKPKPPAKPPKPSAKPTNLATSTAKNDSSEISSAPLPPSTSVDSFTSNSSSIQPPAEASMTNIPEQGNKPFHSTLPPSSSPRVPFKPSRKISSHSISSLASFGGQTETDGVVGTRPVSMVEISPVQFKTAILSATIPVKEDEEEFQGVANLRSRFQQMAPSSSDPATADTRPHRTSSRSHWR